MSSFHVNPKTGKPGRCSATEGNCPFGGEHFSSEKEARQAYEDSMNPFNSPETMKKFQEEPLLEELKPWVTPGPFGGFLNHPLVQDMMVDAMPGMANLRLRDKQKRLKNALEKEDWNSYIFLHERPYRFQALQELLYTHEPENAAQLVRSVWIDSENIHQNYEEWGDVLRESGMAMEEEDEKALADLPQELKIYRGCTQEGDEGYSWTTDRKKAEWFARRFETPGARVISGTIAKASIVAHLTTRGESEIVALPEHVSRVV